METNEVVNLIEVKTELFLKLNLKINTQSKEYSFIKFENRNLVLVRN